MYRITIILLFSLAITLGNPSRQLKSRIVGGKLGKIEDFPYLAAILHRSIVKCGSAIINTKSVITAAHCFKNVILEKLKVRIGSVSGEKHGTVIDVEDYVIHPKYSQLTQDFDIGIVWLRSSIEYDSNIQPINLPNVNEALINGIKGMVAGWGRLYENGPFTDNFNFFKAPIIETIKCTKQGGGGYENWRITQRMFCAGYLEGKQDSCKSDSGGPFVTQNKLIGIVSFGKGCAKPKFPGVYTNVSNMRSWIDQVLLEKSSGKIFYKV